MDAFRARGPEPDDERHHVRRPPDQDQDAGPGRSRPVWPTQLSPQVPGASVTSLQRSTAGGDDPLGGAAVPEAVETVLRRRRGAGTPLPGAIEQSMSTGFGEDMSGVRIHADPEAARISRHLQAEAFTRGQDIYFATGAYRPESSPGRRLLAHELAHVVQQRRDRAPSGIVGRADDPAEKQADQLADRAIRPSSPAPVVTDPRSPGRAAVQRYTVDKKNKKAHESLRARYIQVKDAGDYHHYYEEFETKAADADSVAEMEALVSQLEKEKASRPVPAAAAASPLVPASSTVPAAAAASSSAAAAAAPTPAPGPAKKAKAQAAPFVLGPASYVKQPKIVVDIYAGLPANARDVAQRITAWTTPGHDGCKTALTLGEQDKLQTWVLAQQTPSGLGKYVVNIGPGTGVYAGWQQFKVSKRGAAGGKAPTFHVRLHKL